MRQVVHLVQVQSRQECQASSQSDGIKAQAETCGVGNVMPSRNGRIRKKYPSGEKHGAFSARVSVTYLQRRKATSTQLAAPRRLCTSRSILNIKPCNFGKF